MDNSGGGNRAYQELSDNTENALQGHSIYEIDVDDSILKCGY